MQKVLGPNIGPIETTEGWARMQAKAGITLISAMVLEQ
jgi:hypothetical protein